MLQESTDKFHGIKRCGFPFFLLTIFILKRNGMVFNALDTVIGDGNPEYIPGKVAKRVKSFSHGLAVGNPRLRPEVRVDLIEEMCFLHSVFELGSEDEGQGLGMNEEILS